MPNLSGSYVYNVALHQRIFQQEIINTMAIRVENTGTNVDEASWLAALFQDDTGWFNVVAGMRQLLCFCQTGEVTHEKWRVSRVVPSLSQPYDFPISTRAAGLLAGTCETANVAMSVSRKGADGGRKNIGRVAFAGMPAAFRASGKFTATALTAGNLAAGFLVGRRNLGAALGIISFGFYVGEKKATETKPLQPAHYVECVTGSAQESVRTQRSRTVGKGS